MKSLFIYCLKWATIGLIFSIGAILTFRISEDAMIGVPLISVAIGLTVRMVRRYE